MRSLKGLRRGNLVDLKKKFKGVNEGFQKLSGVKTLLPPPLDVYGLEEKKSPYKIIQI